MTEESIEDIINSNVSRLQIFKQQTEGAYIPKCRCSYPSHEKLVRFVEYVRNICFPGYFEQVPEAETEHRLRENLYRIHEVLPDQIFFGMAFAQGECDTLRQQSERMALLFMNEIPNIKRLLATDVKAVLNSDPAAQNEGEVILCYPSINAMLHHRIAHALFRLGVPIVPRIIAEFAHSQTGIDIHPGASIGEYFSIDHGTGVVIGKTAIIGNNVCIYQGVTLGAKSFSYDELGKPVDAPRHPIIEDGVTIYSNASILGRITIGRHSVIGGNIWVTQSVPPHSRIVQQRAINVSFSDGAGI